MQRKMEIGFNKAPATPQDIEKENAAFEHKVNVVMKTVEQTAFKIGLTVCGYVALDTVRQIVIKKFAN